MVPVAAVLCLAASTVDSTVDDHYLQDSSNTGDDVHPHGHPRATKMYACLQNCAYCVQFWEHGKYFFVSKTVFLSWIGLGFVF